jgi:C-terminal processing protease CtpA/Prc
VPKQRRFDFKLGDAKTLLKVQILKMQGVQTARSGSVARLPVHSTARSESKIGEKRQSFQSSTVASRAASCKPTTCGVGIVLGANDDAVVISEVVDGGPAQRYFSIYTQV